MEQMRTWLLYFLYAGFFLFQALPAQAGAYFDTTVTPAEKAIFAFFRAAHALPDYESWIKPGARYKALPPEKQEDFLLKETLRLGRGYGLYDLQEHPLEMEITGRARYIPATDAAPARMTFSFPGPPGTAIPTFYYPYGKNRIALIVDSLSAFSNLKLDAQQAAALSQKAPYADQDFNAVLTVYVRVVRADPENPVETDTGLQWLMAGDIAYIQCAAHAPGEAQKRVLWDYVAPWYAEQFRLRTMPEEEKYPHPYDLFKD